MLIKQYEEIKRERGSSSDNSGESATGGIIPSISDQALYRELEHTLVASKASPTTRPYDEAMTSEGTTPPSGSAGSGSGSSDSWSRNKGPPTLPHGHKHQHQHQHQYLQAAATTPDAPRAPCVLVVDDSNVSCQIAKRGLSNSNIGVEVSGVSRAHEHPCTG